MLWESHEISFTAVVDALLFQLSLDEVKIALFLENVSVGHRKKVSFCNTCFSRLHFRICTNLSAAPFKAMWYDGIKVCFTPLFIKKVLKAEEINQGPLSVTISSGRPYDANNARSVSHVFSVVVLLKLKTSNHLEWLSMITRNV